nr:MAG TPA: hypothetical protein [Caudoviricetes sp.]
MISIEHIYNTDSILIDFITLDILVSYKNTNRYHRGALWKSKK